MDVLVVEASFQEKPVLHRLMQLYLYDSTEFTGEDAGQDGVFTYRYFYEYWHETERFPFLIYCGVNLAGFSLVNSHTMVLEQGAGRSIAEFFVMRKYRRRGVGRRAASYGSGELLPWGVGGLVGSSRCSWAGIQLATELPHSEEFAVQYASAHHF